MKLFLATKNPGKLRELRAVLADQPWATQIEVVSAEVRPDIPEPEETGATFAENARLKARAYARATGLPALADDSGLEVDALNGAPGVQSARYERDEQSRNNRLLHELERVSSSTANHPAPHSSPVPAETDPARSARFVCAMAFASPDGHILGEAHGRLEGFIARTPRGNHGFGYDPVFHVAELGCRLAEAAPEVKNRISHRARALHALLPTLKAWAAGELSS